MLLVFLLLNRTPWLKENIRKKGVCVSVPMLSQCSDKHNPGDGPRDKLNNWLDKEHDLHREHRGVLQAKPARTAAWLKDNIKDATAGVHDLFDRNPHERGVDKEA